MKTFEPRPMLTLDLSREDDYNIASALRGPDSDDVWMKMMTTCVIRYFVGIRSNVGAAVMDPEHVKTNFAFLSLADLKDKWSLADLKDKWHATANHHFQWHVTAAFVALKHRGIEGAAEYWDWWKEQMSHKDEPDDIAF